MVHPGVNRSAANGDAAPPPWSYNPSAWSQRIPVALLAAVAFGIAGYLAAFQWGLVATVWDPIFGRQSASVLESPVADRLFLWFRIPDAALGAFAYLGDTVLALAGSTRRWQYRPWLVVLFGIDVIPLGIVSVILVILQFTVLGEWCFLCMVTAGISLILILYAYDEVWSCLLYLKRVAGRTGNARLLWNTFWGQASPEAETIAEEFLQERRTHRYGTLFWKDEAASSAAAKGGN